MSINRYRPFALIYHQLTLEMFGKYAMSRYIGGPIIFAPLTKILLPISIAEMRNAFLNKVRYLASIHEATN